MLPSPLYAIVDAGASMRYGLTAIDTARLYLDGGARLIQLRAKALTAAGYLRECRALVDLARPYGARVVVNDRADLARLAEAWGVHVGQDDLSPAAARAVLLADQIVGVSTHTAPQIDRAVLDGVDYLAVGPVFATATKDTGYRPVGLELVRYAVARGGGIPVVAIGGITLDNCAAVFEAGAQSVAVIGDLLADGRPAARVARYVEIAAR